MKVARAAEFAGLLAWR